MKFIADFHLHSRYSLATSHDMEVETLDRLAKLKGIKVLGTGDFTHPSYLAPSLACQEEAARDNQKDDCHPAQDKSSPFAHYHLL